MALDTHGMDPVKVIRLARALGAEFPAPSWLAANRRHRAVGGDENLRRHADGAERARARGG